MIAGLDSSFFRPSAAQLAQARATGVRVWGGYLTTKPNVGIASPWDQASFERVRAVLGTTPIAWASGWDDPVACKQKAAAWNVKLGLDDESGIRVGLTPLEEEHVKRRIANRGPRRLDGSWVQPWLDASGAGLYGNAPVFNGRRASFFVLAAYPSSGNPGRTWPAGAALPQVPCGWQWQGTHDEFGGGVDRGNYDDWFLGGDDDLPYSKSELIQIVQQATSGHYALADATYNGVKYGSTPDKGDGRDSAGQPAGEVAGVTLLKKLSGLDVQALAAAIAPLLPHLNQSDVATVAKAVVDEIGARVKPAV